MSSTELTPEAIRRAEQLIVRIRGVTACRIAVNGGGEVTEVHVVAATDKPPKLVARDVESCLKAELGIDVDYKRIGVVIVGDGEPDASPVEASSAAPADVVEEFPIEEHPSRFAFRSVNLFMSREGVRVEVELVRDGVEAFGSKVDQNICGEPWPLVAEATLRAVSEYLDDDIRLCLGGVLKVALGDASAFLVRVDVVDARSAKQLAGCSIIAGDQNQSVVFAALDAVNRVIGKLDFKRSIEYRIS